MALRNQPYIPLYVQDFLSDEKLRECSAESLGVYILVMCVMHKSEYYGMILLKQKDKQEVQQVYNFANKLVKHLPFSSEVILRSLLELIKEKVLIIENDFLIQKRMVKDNHTSEARSRAGSIGAKRKKEKANPAKAKVQASSEYEYKDDNEDSSTNNKSKKPLNLKPPTLDEFTEYAHENMTARQFGFLEQDLIFKFKSWEANNWHTGGKNPRAINNWKTTLLNTLKYLIADLKNRDTSGKSKPKTASEALQGLVKNKNSKDE